MKSKLKRLAVRSAVIIPIMIMLILISFYVEDSTALFGLMPLCLYFLFSDNKMR